MYRHLMALIVDFVGDLCKAKAKSLAQPQTALYHQAMEALCWADSTISALDLDALYYVDLIALDTEVTHVQRQIQHALARRKPAT